MERFVFCVKIYFDVAIFVRLAVNKGSGLTLVHFKHLQSSCVSEGVRYYWPFLIFMGLLFRHKVGQRTYLISAIKMCTTWMKILRSEGEL